MKDKKKKPNPYATPYWVYIIIAVLFVLFTWWGGFPIWEGATGIILKDSLQLVYGLIFLVIICLPFELLFRYIRKKKMKKSIIIKILLLLILTFCFFFMVYFQCGLLNGQFSTLKETVQRHSESSDMKEMVDSISKHSFFVIWFSGFWGIFCGVGAYSIIAIKNKNKDNK